MFPNPSAAMQAAFLILEEPARTVRRDGLRKFHIVVTTLLPELFIRPDRLVRNNVISA